MIDLISSHSRVSQAPADGLLRKAGDMLDTIQTLFLDGAYQLTTDHKRCGSVTMKRIETEDDHALNLRW
jgi:hypothetical protein